MKIGILGAGTWGIALAALLANNKHDVTVWSALPYEIDELESNRKHKNLPGTTLPDSIKYTKNIGIAADAEMILFVVPSSFIRNTTREISPYIRDGVIIASAAKGIEKSTLLTMTEVIGDELDKCGITAKYSLAALSGPTHAEEVALGIPTSIVAACDNEAISMKIADAFSNSCMRAYTNSDVLGVEICGAMKNIIALAAGMNNGMGLGDNSKALLMTRGIAEISRLGLAMGCHKGTFIGLAGIGDLIVTCTSRHSRNNRCGELIGMGKSYAEASKEIGMVVEGYYALDAAMELSKKYEVELPITEAVYKIIHEGLSPKEAMLALMVRDLKSELDN